MTADLRAAAEKVRAEVPPDLAELAADFPHPWLVVRQYTNLDAKVMSSHRFELMAEWKARRLAKRDRASVTIARYTVVRRRAES